MNSKIKVLIASDEAEDRELLVEGLSDCISNFEVETVSNGAEYLTVMKNGCKPDIVFLNLNMPVKSGLECLRETYNNHIAEDVPVILCSTSQNLKDIKAASGFGARFYMIKPSSDGILKQLLMYIFKLLGLPRQEQQLKQNFVVAHDKLARVLNYHFSM